MPTEVHGPRRQPLLTDTFTLFLDELLKLSCCNKIKSRKTLDSRLGFLPVLPRELYDENILPIV